MERRRPDPSTLPAAPDFQSVEHQLIRLCTASGVEWLRSAAGPGSFRLIYGRKKAIYKHVSRHGKTSYRTVETNNTLMYFSRSQTVQIGPKTFPATPAEAIDYLLTQRVL